jgi:hypothetical protein
VQRQLGSLYATGRQAPVTDFVLSEEEAAEYPGGGSRTLVTQDGDQVALGVVFEREIGPLLAGADPRVRLDHANLGAFCTLTEEVSHFVYLLFRRYRLAEPLSAEQAERYRTASGLAYRYCSYLESRYLRASRLADLAREARRFYRLGQREKLERIAALPA